MTEMQTLVNDNSSIYDAMRIEKLILRLINSTREALNRDVYVITLEQPGFTRLFEGSGGVIFNSTVKEPQRTEECRI
ncbi:hypothetical protein V9T40_010594 [Parthenolecanium corni]|uniref:Uncharacterized protein n=1 Tax=Parthenolecanium corni TaxID=536013 RepID=A0AAN9XYL8_9HEMI